MIAHSWYINNRQPSKRSNNKTAHVVFGSAAKTQRMTEFLLSHAIAEHKSLTFSSFFSLVCLYVHGFFGWNWGKNTIFMYFFIWNRERDKNLEHTKTADRKYGQASSTDSNENGTAALFMCCFFSGCLHKSKVVENNKKPFIWLNRSAHSHNNEKSH